MRIYLVHFILMTDDKLHDSFFEGVFLLESSTLLITCLIFFSQSNWYSSWEMKNQSVKILCFLYTSITKRGVVFRLFTITAWIYDENVRGYCTKWFLRLAVRRSWLSKTIYTCQLVYNWISVFTDHWQFEQY